MRTLLFLFVSMTVIVLCSLFTSCKPVCDPDAPDKSLHQGEIRASVDQQNIQVAHAISDYATSS